MVERSQLLKFLLSAEHAEVMAELARAGCVGKALGVPVPSNPPQQLLFGFDVQQAGRGDTDAGAGRVVDACERLA